MSDMPRVLRKNDISIGPVPVRGAAFLAPMAGITDAPFREIAREYGAALVVSEMVASAELVEGGLEASLRACHSGSGPHVVQLAGREAHWLAEGARIAEANGADIIDLNMGCPSKRVTSGLCGSALMRDLDRALDLVEATVSATSLPVTLKTRLGWDDSSLNAPELAARAEAAGVQMVTIHGRTRCQFYKGAANWAAVRAIRDAISVPLVVNGDILSVEDAENALRASGADAVMIGRGAQGRPWFVGEVSAALTGRVRPTAPTGPDLADLVARHYEAMLSHYGAPLGVRCARKHLNWYWEQSNASDDISMKRALMTENVPDTVLGLIRRAFSGQTVLRHADQAAA